MRLVYSRDDAEKYGAGWYWESYDNQTSQRFPTEALARYAKLYGQLIWES